MSAPKYKKQKWNIAECKTCKLFMQERNIDRCKKQGHSVVPRPNEAFVIPRLKFKYFTRTYSGKSRAVLTSPMIDRIEMSMRDFEELLPLLDHGEFKEKGWFLWTRKSSNLGVKFLGLDEE